MGSVGDRFWDGQQWTSQRRVPQPPAPTYTSPGPQQYPGPLAYQQVRQPQKRPNRWVWWLAAGAAVIVVLALIGAMLPDPDTDTASTTTATAAPADPTPTTAAAAVSTIDTIGEDEILPFGQAHARSASFLGASWSVSIDEVRQVGDCTAIIGWARLDALDSDELTSNPFDFPDPKLIVNGREINADEAGPDFSCVTSPTLEKEGLIWDLNVSLAPGGQVDWYHLFHNPGGAYDFVAIEDVKYAAI